jgi:hypothetical protein
LRLRIVRRPNRCTAQSDSGLTDPGKESRDFKGFARQRPVICESFDLCRSNSNKEVGPRIDRINIHVLCRLSEKLEIDIFTLRAKAMISESLSSFRGTE